MPLHIPTVTEEDLRAFHLSHFAGSALPATVFTENDYETFAEDEDDGLGYYDDGAKRTLTDEQIAMFRHSEIETLLRERRLRLEAEADAAEEGEVDEDGEREASPQMSSTMASISARSEKASVSSQPSGFKPAVKAPVLKKQTPREYRKAKHARLQRQLQERQARLDQSPDDFTPNRTAREQDEVKQDDVELDYG